MAPKGIEISPMDSDFSAVISPVRMPYVSGNDGECFRDFDHENVVKIHENGVIVCENTGKNGDSVKK